MNRLAVAAGAVSLAQGFPDFACPPELKDAAAAAIDDDINQYAITWGASRCATRSRATTARTSRAGAPSTPRRRSPSPAARPRR